MIWLKTRDEHTELYVVISQWLGTLKFNLHGEAFYGFHPIFRD